MTVVYLHPIGLDGASWSFVDDPPLTDGMRYDLLWHGGRPEPQQTLTLRAFAEDVLEHVSGPLDIVGISLGGAVAQHIALERPRRVNSLCLVACGAGGKGGAEQIRQAELVESRGIEGVIEPTLKRWFSPAALRVDHPGVQYARDALGRNPAAAFAASWRALSHHSTVTRLSGIRCPTTVIHAVADAAASEEDRRVLVEGIPHARFRRIDGPHMAQLENPHAVRDELEQHLAWARAS